MTDRESFELWKEKEIEHAQQVQQEELTYLVNKIQASWEATQDAIAQGWQSKDEELATALANLEKYLTDYNAMVATKQKLKKQKQELEDEARELAKPKPSARDQQLIRISTINAEINSVKDEIEQLQQRLQVETAKRDRYKRLYTENNEVLQRLKAKRKKQTRSS